MIMKHNNTLIQAIRGMNDVLPADIQFWQHIESLWRQICRQYHYEEIRTPIVEHTQLFSRTVGEQTDIVTKEMYTFEDRNGDSLSLRPEGTAGCVRACIEHGLTYHNIQRLWYLGAMFRHERPQKGRYRQFYQIGVETYGLHSPAAEIELILLNARFLKALGLEDLQLEINTIGSAESRQRYQKVLTQYLNQHQHRLDADSKRRLKRGHPLRILDSKNIELAELIKHAPVLSDYLSEDSSRHFDTVCQLLKDASIPYKINPHLVRGLDYYNDTVFEWKTQSLGAQGTVSAGGRYDDLVSMLGGQPTAAVGFALGLERLVLMLKNKSIDIPSVDLFLMPAETKWISNILLLAEKLRDALPYLSIHTHLSDGKLKRQFKHADKSNARFALIIGQAEQNSHTISIKNLRETVPQQTLTMPALIEFLHTQFKRKTDHEN
jgi:histidyl-tRNA synthetase